MISCAPYAFLWWLQVFSAEAEACGAELGSRSQLAASLLLQRKRHRGPDLWLQCGHHASATGFVCMTVCAVGEHHTSQT